MAALPDGILQLKILEIFSHLKPFDTSIPENNRILEKNVHIYATVQILMCLVLKMVDVASIVRRFLCYSITFPVFLLFLLTISTYNNRLNDSYENTNFGVACA